MEVVVVGIAGEVGGEVVGGEVVAGGVVVVMGEEVLSVQKSQHHCQVNCISTVYKLNALQHLMQEVLALYSW